ncbi:MAG: DEAD/DEAH box helicase, partial [Rhodospirillales bacterium]|nr:DEAD/DEAH box helicase [Rhodospirillales bacterium]
MLFENFFEQAMGRNPYAYQRVLAEDGGYEALIAPTGLGKTAAVILAWLWRRRVHPEATPRRLVYCLPMRTLVEQTAENARVWLERLKQAPFATNLPASEDLHLLMGGVESRPGRLRWDDSPERSAILIGTQDMLISRALMRGYAAGRSRWPV